MEIFRKDYVGRPSPLYFSERLTKISVVLKYILNVMSLITQGHIKLIMYWPNITCEKNGEKGY